MKKIYTLFVLCALALSTQGRVRTVSNNPAIPAQYGTMDAAVTASSNGDTLLISGSPNNYTLAANLTKRLVIIGPGIKPTLGTRATISYVTMDSSNLGNSKGSVIAGMYMDGYLSINTNVSNVEVKDSWLNGLYVGNGCRNTLIHNNIIGQIYIYNLSRNTLVSNNILSGISSQSTTAIATNNLFISNTGDCLNGTTDMVISNNIFYGRTPRGAANCVFSNNLTYITNNNTLPYGTNTGGGNIENQDPLLTTTNGVQYDINLDYRLQPGSPAHNAGTDGTDLGPTGGGYPWYQQLSYNGILPWVQELNILNASVTPTGSLQVRVKGRKGR